MRQPGRVPMRVLIVDDDPWFRETAGELLRARGFAVAGEASNYGEALAAVRELEPDGVLVDVHLPDVDGFEVAAKLSAHGDGPRVLLTSCDREAATENMAERCRAVGFVPKTELASADLVRYFSGGGPDPDPG
jgi:DNA-binding NarL/FixJ family response regulator